MASNDERQHRIEKLKEIRDAGIIPYIDKCSRTHTLAQARDLEVGTKDVELCGRLMLKRVFGKLMFATIQDFTGRLQIAVDANSLDADKYSFFQKLIDIGDFVWVKGEIIKTHKGELTLHVKSYTLLSKSIRPLPEKYHGIADLETRSRQRYLDLVMDPATMERFMKRLRIVKTIREFLDSNEFLEVETPVLQTKPSGAIARPFVTHHSALDIDLFLRISPETYLKRCIAGGFERVYEIARCFRNEGIDASHLQDFTLLECYAAYWNYEDNMRFTEALVKDLVQKVNGSLKITYGDKEIDFSGDWPRKSLRDLILEKTGIDIFEFTEKDGLVAKIKEKKIKLEDVDLSKISLGNLIDQLYKKKVREELIQPMFLIHHPIDVSPLARTNDSNPKVVDRFQLLVNGWETINGYSELVDPIDQMERLVKQARDREGGDEEAMVMEEDFVLCMEYGMPPISGWGMGIDRFAALLSNQENLRDVVLFPLMRPLEPGKEPMDATEAGE
jgi:lysyl-tRNA synthetase class 2